jgi:hypothetical protein
MVLKRKNIVTNSVRLFGSFDIVQRQNKSLIDAYHLGILFDELDEKEPNYSTIRLRFRKSVDFDQFLLKSLGELFEIIVPIDQSHSKEPFIRAPD